MAEKIKIDLDIDAGSSLKTMGDLEASVESMMDELKQTDVASDRFNELQSSIAGATSKIKDMELGMEGLDMEQKSSEIGSFAAGLADTATGALALSGALGITNENSEKMIENLVSGMAVAQTFRGGLDGIISAQKLLRNVTVKSAVAQRVLNAVMKANPIVLLISLLAAGVAAFASFSGEMSQAEKEAEALKRKEEELIEAQKELNNNVAEQSTEFVGLIEQLKLTNEGSEKRKGLINDINDKYGTTLKNIKDETKFQNQLNSAVDTYIQSKINQLKLKANEEEITELILERLEIEKAGEELRAKGIDTKRKRTDEELKLFQDRNNEIIKLQNNMDLFDESKNVDARARIKELKKAIKSSNSELQISSGRLAEINNELSELGAINLGLSETPLLGGKGGGVSNSTKEVKKLAVGLQEIDDLLNNRSDSEGPEGDEIKQEIEKIDKEHTIRLTKIANFERDKTFTKEEADAQRLIAERERLDKLRTVQLNYNLETEETDLKITRNKLALSKMTDAEILANKKKTNDDIIEDEKKTAEEKRAIASQTIGVISQGMGAVASLMQTSNKAEIEAAEGNEAKQKKLRKEGFEQQKKFQIATAVMGMAQGIISGLGAPFPMNITMPIAAGVTGAAQIAKIASTTFTGGGGGGSTPTPSVSTAAPNIRETPDVNLFGQGNEGSEGDSSQFGSQGQGNQIQAVVSWTDIEAVQNNDSNIQQEMQL